MDDTKGLKIKDSFNKLFDDGNGFNFGQFSPFSHILVQVHSLDKFKDNVVMGFGDKAFSEFWDGGVV